MMVFLGADHRGYPLKESLKTWLTQNNYQVEDLGAESLDMEDDYPVFAESVAKRVSANPTDRGVVICGSGVGVDIVANKFDGVRSGLGINQEQIAAARRDDNINVLALAADILDESTGQAILKSFLETEFEDAERRTRRLHEIEEIENEQ